LNGSQCHWASPMSPKASKERRRSLRKRSTTPVSSCNLQTLSGAADSTLSLWRLFVRRKAATLRSAFAKLRIAGLKNALEAEERLQARHSARHESSDFESAELRERCAIVTDEVAAAWRQAQASDQGHAAMMAAFSAAVSENERLTKTLAASDAANKRLSEELAASDQAHARRDRAQKRRDDEHAAELKGQQSRESSVEEMEQMLIETKMELAMLKASMR